MPNDVFALLTIEHRQVERLLDQLAESDEGPEREGLVDQLRTSLTMHLEFEEEHLYPTAAAMDPELAEEAEIEHELARLGLAKVSELSTAPGFGAAVAMLAGGIDHHVHDEESEMFPRMRDHLDESTRLALVDALVAAKRSAGTPPPETATKEELVEMAAAASIDGRSSMTKDELRSALAGN